MELLTFFGIILIILFGGVPLILIPYLFSPKGQLLIKKKNSEGFRKQLKLEEQQKAQLEAQKEAEIKKEIEKRKNYPHFIKESNVSVLGVLSSGGLMIVGIVLVYFKVYDWGLLIAIVGMILTTFLDNADRLKGKRITDSELEYVKLAQVISHVVKWITIIGMVLLSVLLITNYISSISTSTSNPIFLVIFLLILILIKLDNLKK